MTITFHAADLTVDELEENLLQPPSAQPLDGDITTRSRVYFTDETHGIISGTWESEPGAARWEFTHRGEIITVISGTMTVHEDGGEPVQLSPGDTAYFPIGWNGVWTVHERLRKAFVVYLGI